MTQWIKTSERKPEPNPHDPGYWRNHIIAYWLPGRESTDGYMAEIDYRKYVTGGDLWGNYMSEPDYWMPMPEPPQQEDE